MDTPEYIFKDLWTSIKSKKVWCGVLKNLKKDGSEFYVNVTITPILDVNGDIVEYMNISSEITEVISLHKEIEDTQKEIIYKMGEITESRSKETGNHIKRVAEYSKALAIHFGLPNNEAELIKMSAPMHDLGKVAISDAILNKPGRFTDEEFEIMKTHSKIGYEMLKGSNREILSSAAIIAKEHHEKFDGTGYPDGLKGEEIHIYARIVALADVFDALGSDRCYKKAWEFGAILEFFKEQRGKHFDPRLIDIFFENLDEFIAIRDRYKE
jgi:response regulator RpfG family c-di-GMP phosphodiesterase